MKEAETALVTNDRWMKEEGGQLDAMDREILNEISQNGRLHVRIISIKEMFEEMKNTEPEKYRQFQGEMENQAGKRLTFDDIVELGQIADVAMQGFTEITRDMTLGEAAQVRIWRVGGRMTWRSLARTAYLEGWFHRGWEPASNLLMGMALADKAAQLFNENFRQAPWN